MLRAAPAGCTNPSHLTWAAARNWAEGAGGAGGCSWLRFGAVASSWSQATSSPSLLGEGEVTCGNSFSLLRRINLLWGFQHMLWNAGRKHTVCFECHLYICAPSNLSAVCVPPLASRPQERGDEPADPALEIFKQASALSKVKTKNKQKNCHCRTTEITFC